MELAHWEGSIRLVCIGYGAAALFLFRPNNDGLGLGCEHPVSVWTLLRCQYRIRNSVCSRYFDRDCRYSAPQLED